MTIRINWKLVKCLSLVLFVVYCIELFVYYLNKKENASLSYDYSKRQFYFESNRNLKKENFRTPFQIRSASIHYSRVLEETWLDTIENALKLGLNTIQIDIPWSNHEKSPIKYDFNQKSSDLETFISLVYLKKLYLIVRIDPYIYCSSFDLGGLPSWLLGDANLELRENNFGGLLNLNDEKFTIAFKRYLDNLLPILSKYQNKRNGPIIGILIQNYEFDLTIYDNDQLTTDLSFFYNENYLNFLKDAFYEHDIIEMIFINRNMCDLNSYKTVGISCDPNLSLYMPAEDIRDENIKLKNYLPKFSRNSNCLEDTYAIYGKYFNVDALNHVKDIIERKNVASNFEKVESLLEFKYSLIELLNLKRSFNIMNFLSETNFGLDVAAHHNFLNNLNFPISTSVFNHKVQCFIDENGELTQKFFLASEIIQNFYLLKRKNGSHENLSKQLFNVKNNDSKKPFDLEHNNLIELNLNYILSYEKIVEILMPPILPKKKWNQLNIPSMEYLSLNSDMDVVKNFGFILYRLKNALKKETKIFIDTSLIRDYAIIICNLKEVLITIDHYKKISKDQFISISLKTDCEYFDILVENMGRLSDLIDIRMFSKQRKGILSDNALFFSYPNKQNSSFEINKWNIHFLDFNQDYYNRIYFSSKWFYKRTIEQINGPFMAFSKFNVKKVSDTENRNFNVKQENKEKYQNNFYLYMKNWTKGIVFINGFCIGRYWSEIGNVLSLYVPNNLLNNGENDLIIFELKKSTNTSIYLTHNHVFT